MRKLHRLICGIAVAGLVASACSTTSPSAPVPAQAQSSQASSTPEPTPRRTSTPTPRPTSGAQQPSIPPPTIAPARTWSSGGIELDLPAGWSSPPDAHVLAIIFALDQLGDPPAGLYSMMLNAGGRSTEGRFVLRDSPGLRPSAILGARLSAEGDQTLRAAVDAAQSSLDAFTDSTRGRLALPAGATPFLEWEQPVRWGSIHIRAYFFKVPDGIARIDIGTEDVLDPDLEAELYRILESVRPIGG